MASASVAVLIFDDDEPTRLLYQRELERVYQVFTCGTELDALSILRTEQINVLILEPAALRDEVWSFINVVRALPQRKRLPFIVCSTLDARRRGHELGAAAYLIKPVAPASLRSTVGRVLHDDPSAREATGSH
jgi:DNA-binding response OmpR family regulator